MADRATSPNDRLQAVTPATQARSGDPTFALVKIKAVQKPGLEEGLVAPPGGTGTPCAYNAVCSCVPVQQCGCDSVCTCDAVSACAPYESPCYSCMVVCIRIIIFH